MILNQPWVHERELINFEKEKEKKKREKNKHGLELKIPDFLFYFHH